ncbi:beta-3 adrenergic receptor [Nelusetta ayraudi]|uniref:beta-3 adrenergic receptor n=1 Tax=Nelusetta ayraudi TaxID=303726 RepID=UPI003F703F28
MEAEPCGGSMYCCTPATRLLTVVFMALLVVAILLGNLLTLAVILGSSSSSSSFSRPRLHTPQSYLKASLAAADLVVGVLVVPLSVYTEAGPLLGLPPPAWTSSSSSSGHGLHPCSLVGPVFAGCTLVSISTVFLLSLERAVALLRPLHRDWLVTRRRTALLVALSWLGSFSLAVAPLLFGGDIVLEYNSCSRMCTYVLGGAERTSSRTWNILLLFPAFDFTLLAATLLVNIISFSSIRQHSRRRRRLAQGPTSSSSSSSTAKPTFSDIKAARTIGALTVAFTASFTPIAVFVVGNVLGHEWCNFSFLAFWILASNSCWNVIIYSVRDHRFRLKAHRLLWPLNRRNSSHK